MPIRPSPSALPRPVAPGPSRIAVVGMGNVLTGDDALGPTVVRWLDALFEMPPGVEVVDAGTPGMDLAGLLADVDAAIVVDAFSSDREPGSLETFDRETLLSRPLQPRTNPHAPGLAETLLSLEFAGLGPGPVLLVGVVPRQVDVGEPLSAPVAAAIPRVLDTVCAALTRWGAPPAPRTHPSAPDLWWQRSPALAPP